MKTKIEFEEFESTIVRIRQSRTVSAFCPQCRLQVAHFSVIRAAAILQMPEKAVFHLVIDGAVHSNETATGGLLVCGISVSELAKEFKV